MRQSNLICSVNKENSTANNAINDSPYKVNDAANAGEVNSSPSMELTLSWWGALSTKKYQPECVNDKSSTERRR